jgi:alanine racemase
MHTIPLAMTPDVVAEAVIDLDAIANNIRVLSDHAGSAAVMAVVKADGYGHGATPVSRAVLAAGATELGVATIAEALALRGDGITAPILAWLHPPGTDFAPALRADVQIAVSSVHQRGRLPGDARRAAARPVRRGAACAGIDVAYGLRRRSQSSNQ